MNPTPLISVNPPNSPQKTPPKLLLSAPAPDSSGQPPQNPPTPTTHQVVLRVANRVPRTFQKSRKATMNGVPKTYQMGHSDTNRRYAMLWRRERIKSGDISKRKLGGSGLRRSHTNVGGLLRKIGLGCRGDLFRGRKVRY